MEYEKARRLFIERINGMTEQEIFDKVAAHLLMQNEKSARYGYCKYRLGKLRCAVGVLMDCCYSEEFEGKSLSGLLDEVDMDIDLPKERLLNTLQNLHDDHEPYEWPGCLSSVARRFKLECKHE